MDERLKRDRQHRSVMFKNRVKADHLQVCTFEDPFDAPDLREGIRDASRAEKLKRMKQDDPAAEALEA